VLKVFLDSLSVLYGVSGSEVATSVLTPVQWNTTTGRIFSHFLVIRISGRGVYMGSFSTGGF